MEHKALGRRVPPDWEHYTKYPLTATTAPAAPVPVVIGVNWYSSFDAPVRDGNGRYWIGRGTSLGRIRGGHAVCVPADHGDDARAWWEWYDQGKEGACVGFAASRMMSHLNRKRYDARKLWNRAKQIDEWPDTNPGDDSGTSVRAALDILATEGHWRVYRGRTAPLARHEGISVYRWARTADDVLAVVQNRLYERLGAVAILNSWGRAYPKVVFMPLETLQRLINEDGEVALVTDR